MKTDDRTPYRQRTTERAAREDWQKTATSPEELESSRRPDRCRTTREREKPRPNPGENTQERIGTKSNRTPPSRGLEDVKPTGTPTSFREERCHHVRQ